MSARKRKSQWDSKEEPLLPAQISENNALQGKANHSNLHASHDPKWSNLEADYSLKTEDCSRQRPSWEPSQGNSGQRDDSRDLNDIRENRKALDGDKSYHVSPGFDDWGQQNNSRSPGNSWSQSHRYGRSRSRSRSRGRGRGRSRSRSRGRGRSRSRSRDGDWGKSRSRSRTPLGGYRQESYRWSDRRSGSGVSSQPCRDFTAGKCRRGSQCRFIHQDNLNDRDGGRLDKDQAEIRRSRQERGGHFYDGEKDEPPRNSSKSSMLCNDFLKGRCLKGSSCRYSHHDVSGDYSERSHRNSSFNHDYQRQPRKTGSTPCRFFLMGKCNRENCRFSHDGPVRGNLESKSQDRRRDHDFDDMNKSWNGPKWSEAAAVSDIAQSTVMENWRFSHDGPAQGSLEGKSHNDRRGHDFDDMNRSWNGSKWGEATAVSDIGQSTGWGNVGNGTSIDPITAEKQTDDRWVHKSTGWDNINVENVTLSDPTNTVKLADHRQDLNLDNESRMWSDSEWKGKAADRDENVSPNLGSGSHVVNIGISASKDVEKSFDREEPCHTAQVLQSQTTYGISENVHQQNIMQEASGQQLASTVMHTLFPEKSQIQQHQTKLEDNSAITGDFNSGNGVGIYGNARHSAIVLGQNFDQNADSFVSQTPSFGGINQNRDMISGNLSNGHNIDLNGPVQQNYSPSNLQNQTQIQHGEFVKAMVNSSMPQNIVNSEKVKQITNFPESLTQIFGDGQLPQLYAALNPPNSTELVPSFPDSASLLPPITSMEAQPCPTTMSQKPYDPIGNGTEPNKHGDCNQLPGFLSNSIEQKNQMLLKHLSPSSAVGLDEGKLHKNVCPEDNIHRSPELTQQKPVADSVLGEDSKSIADEGKPELENTRAGNVDVDARAGDGTNGKDEKAMRLFKNALVEFVKEILKPKWKEGQMSREVHKTIVKKVVDKVTSTIQGPNIPNTQDKIDQYLSSNKPRLSKLVEAYTGRLLKSS